MGFGHVDLLDDSSHQSYLHAIGPWVKLSPKFWIKLRKKIQILHACLWHRANAKRLLINVKISNLEVFKKNLSKWPNLTFFCKVYFNNLNKRLCTTWKFIVVIVPVWILIPFERFYLDFIDWIVEMELKLLGEFLRDGDLNSDFLLLQWLNLRSLAILKRCNICCLAGIFLKNSL